MGLRPHETLDLTVRELVAFAKGRVDHERQQWRRATFVAWQTEAFARSKKLDDWNKIDRRFQPKKIQTADQMMEMAKRITAALGGTIKED